MEKQNSRTVKDYLVGRLAEQINIPEKTCNKVLEWVYKEGRTKIKTEDSIEISGFGSFILHISKVRKKLRHREALVAFYDRKLEDTSLLPNVRKRLEDAKASCLRYIEFLKQKEINLDEQDNGVSEIVTERIS